jgi:hypothetical protein
LGNPEQGNRPLLGAATKLQLVMTEDFMCAVVTVSRDSVVGIATSYELDERGVGIRVPVGSRLPSFLRRPE